MLDAGDLSKAERVLQDCGIQGEDLTSSAFGRAALGRLLRRLSAGHGASDEPRRALSALYGLVLRSDREVPAFGQQQSLAPIVPEENRLHRSYSIVLSLRHLCQGSQGVLIGVVQEPMSTHVVTPLQLRRRFCAVQICAPGS